MMSASTIILEYAFPIVGTFVGIYMFYAPFQDVQKALARGSLGDLNPLPWAFTLGNCCGWIVYGILIGNIFVLLPNMIGFFLSVWFNLAASKLLYKQQQQQQQEQQPFVPLVVATPEVPEDQDDDDETKHDTSPDEAPPGKHAAPTHDYYVMVIVMIWATLIAVVGFADSWSLETKQWIVGIAANINLLFFYGAPLSTIATVLQTQNISSIHFLTMVTNTVNSCLWATYGFAILNHLILVPNGIGALLGFVQLGLYLTFSRKTTATTVTENNNNNNNNEPGSDLVKKNLDEEQGVDENSGLTAPVDDVSENLPFPFVVEVSSSFSSEEVTSD
jgi:solute carrier family 50 (sugar transporter)